MSWLFAPGLFESGPVGTALLVGGSAALVSGAIGVFTVMRGQAFAGHALADVSSAGGAASFLLGVNPLAGFLVMGVLGAAGMEFFRAGTTRERDLATGIVLGAGLGLAALLLAIDPAIAPTAVLVGVAALATLAALFRPLLLCSIDPALAAASGVPVRLVGLLHLMALALAVSLSALTVGAILSTALLIGPAAIALRLARSPLGAVALAALLGLAITVLGIVVAYDSEDWTGRSWPASFCIVLVLFAAYVATPARRRS